LTTYSKNSIKGLTGLRFKNFRSWLDTGEIRIAPLTGLFGTNSSGKTAIIQFLLMLKQTIESSDLKRVLYIGDEKSYVDLGTPSNFIYQHRFPAELDFSLAWDLPTEDILLIDELLSFQISSLIFKANIQVNTENILLKNMSYSWSQTDNENISFGMKQEKDSNTGEITAELSESKDYLKRSRGRPWTLPQPIKFYRFPDQIYSYYQNASFLSDIVLAFEKLFKNIYYLGPLRDYPRRSYLWAGEPPQDVGKNGELAIAALLASRKKEKTDSYYIEQQVAKWLRELGLIYDFQLYELVPNQQYEVRVKCTENASEVLITDVGFGVSQILPVLVLCYYAPPGSILIFEQPEIHLHPSVQSGLSDVFIDVIKNRNMQIIIESHSEHLLRRLQRRIAEEQINKEDTALYFCQLDDEGNSQLNPLQLDEFGNINNWPTNFFGDEMGDLIAMTEAAIKRQQKS